MKAVKENRQYTITEVEVASFKSEGYDIYDDNGKLLYYGAGKTVPFEKYMKLMDNVEAKTEEIIRLRAEVEKLTKDLEKATKKEKKGSK